MSMFCASMNKLISICIPVYNSEKYLSDCINSIFKQTYNNIEILFNDNGSTDASFKILQNYLTTDNRIRIFKSKNSGPAGARNLLIDNARGSYLLFVDSDDIIDRDYVLDFVNSINKGSMPICGMSVDYINDGHSVKTNFNDEILKTLSQKIFYLDKLGLLYSPCNKLYDKKIINGFGLRFNENFKNCEDLRFNVDYLKHINDIFIIPKSNYHYRKFDVTSDVNSYRENIIDVALNGIKLKNDLYNYFNLYDDNQQLFLTRTNIDVLNYCIINTISYKKNRNKNEIYRIIKFVFCETDKLKLINKFSPINLYQKIFIICYKIKNIYFTYIIYATLLFIRYRFKKFYYLIRKNIFKGCINS